MIHAKCTAQQEFLKPDLYFLVGEPVLKTGVTRFPYKINKTNSVEFVMLSNQNQGENLSYGSQQWTGLSRETGSWTTTLCWLTTSPPALGFLEEPERVQIEHLKSSCFQLKARSN